MNCFTFVGEFGLKPLIEVRGTAVDDNQFLIALK